MQDFYISFMFKYLLNFYIEECRIYAGFQTFIVTNVCLTTSNYFFRNDTKYVYKKVPGELTPGYFIWKFL